MATDTTVAEVAARFWTHAQTYYRKPDGTPTSKLTTLKLAMGPLVRLYGRTPAAAFGPLVLEAVRNTMIDGGWCRRHVNGQVARVKMIFKWATAKELVPASVHHGLTAVAGLRAGRTPARESEPVMPVATTAVEQTLPHLSPTVAAMVRLQLLTGARPREICGLTTAAVDRTGEVWTFSPADHKTARLVLTPWLNPAEPDAPVFSPTKAEASRLADLHGARRTPLSCGNRPGTNRRVRPTLQPGDRYDVAAYRRAIARGCDAAFPPSEPLGRRDGETMDRWRNRLTEEQAAELARWQSDHRWHPHQLRHTAATAIRKRFGIEAAQHVLGHATLSMTEVYAE